MPDKNDSASNKRNWKTTIVGILTAIGILSTQAVNFLDGDAATSVSMEMVFAALAALGLGWFARDKDVKEQ